MAGLTFDTGVLVALERRRDRARRLFLAARIDEKRITVPAAVVAEWWRGQRGPAAQLLDGLDVEALDEDLARSAGEALAALRRGSKPSVVDAIVMASAARRGDVVYTSDRDDLVRFSAHFPSVRILTV